MTGDADQSRAACPVFAVGSTPSLLYPSSAEQAALSDLRHALLDGSPLTLLLGDDGIGKTQLLNAIRTRLSESHKIASIRLEEFEPGIPRSVRMMMRRMMSSSPRSVTLRMKTRTRHCQAKCRRF